MPYLKSPQMLFNIRSPNNMASQSAMRNSTRFEPKSPGRKKQSALISSTSISTPTISTTNYNLKSDSSQLGVINTNTHQSSIQVSLPRASTIFTPPFTSSFTPTATPTVSAAAGASIIIPAPSPSPPPPPALPTDNMKIHFENIPISNIFTTHTSSNIQNQNVESLVETSGLNLELDSRLFDRNFERERKSIGEFRGVGSSFDSGVDVSTIPNVVRRARLKEEQRVSNVIIQQSESNSNTDSKLFSPYDDKNYKNSTVPFIEEENERLLGQSGADINLKRNDEAEENSFKNIQPKVRGVSSSYWDDYEESISSNYQLQPSLQPSIQPVHPFKDQEKYSTDSSNDYDKYKAGNEILHSEIPSKDRNNLVLFPYLSSGNRVDVSSSSTSSFQPSVLLADRREKLGTRIGVNNIQNKKNVMSEYEMREKRRDSSLITERIPYEIPGGVPASLESSILDLADIMQALSAAKTSVKKERPRRREREGGERERRRDRVNEDNEKDTEWDDGRGILRTEKVKERERERERGLFYPGSLETSASSSPSSSSPSLDDISD